MPMSGFLKRNLSIPNDKTFEGSIITRSRSRAKMAFVCENIYQTWQNGAGILNAWQYGLVIAQKLNNGLLKPKFTVCDSPHNNADNHGHVCSGCFFIWNYSSLSLDKQNGRLCIRCAAKAFAGDPSFDPEKEPQPMWIGRQPRPRIMQVAIDCA